MKLKLINDLLLFNFFEQQTNIPRRAIFRMSLCCCIENCLAAAAESFTPPSESKSDLRIGVCYFSPLADSHLI